MASNYDDVYINCGECDHPEEGVENMIRHILEAHPEYDPKEAETFAYMWAEDVLQEQEAYDIQRSEEFRRHGHDYQDEE